MPDLHKKGYTYKNRTFRHFTFSRIFSKGMRRENNHWKIDDEIFFFASFYEDKAAETAIINLMDCKEFRLGSAEFTIKSIKTIFSNDFQNTNNNKVEFDFMTLSPIVVHKTEQNQDGKKTVYFTPNDQQFYDRIIMNLNRKAKSMGILSDCDVIIKPVKIDTKRSLAIVKYKDFYIKGHTGIFSFSGNRKYAELAMDSGIGTKNAQGFGMIKVIRK
jgi:CRISPR-associated endoribonuclease Cas6